MIKMATTKNTDKNVPAGWCRLRLGELCEQDRNIVEPSTDIARSLMYLSLEHIEGESGQILRTPIDKVDDEGRSTTFYFDERHVLYGKLRPYLNKVALPDGPGRCTTEMIPLLPFGNVDREFLGWLLRRQETVDFAMRDKTGSRMPRADMDSLLSLSVPLPPLSVQRQISGELCERMAVVNAARAASQARIEAIQKLAPAYYREAFGRHVPFAASPMTPRHPTQAGWRWYRLTDLARLATGHTPSRYHAEYWKGEVPWIQLADIRALDGKETFDTSEHTNELGIKNSAAVLLPKGTVCMSRTASVGFFSIMGRTMATSQDFVNWVCGSELDPWFLMHLLIASRGSIRDLGSGAVHHTIYFPTVEAFSVCIPRLTEQRRITELLRHQMEAVGNARAAAEEELKAISALPAALLRVAI